MSRHGARLATLVLGDSHPLVRDPIDLLRLTFAPAAAALAFQGDPEAIRVALTFVVLLVARRLELPRPCDLLLVVGMGFQAYGNAFGLFDAWPAYDRVVHFVLPLATAPAVYILLIRLRVVPDLADDAVASLCGGLLLVVWRARGWGTTRRVPARRVEVRAPARELAHRSQHPTSPAARRTLGGAARRSGATAHRPAAPA